MPIHSKSKSHGGAAADSKPKTKSSAATFAAGGAKNGAEKTRSAVTGRQLGRAAIRSLNKNADAASEYLDSVLSASSLADLQLIISKAFVLGTVVRQLGAGRISVTLQTGDREVNLPIKGVLRFKGRANTDAKKERGNNMQPGDFVLVDGGQASARLSFAQADRVRRAFDRHSLAVPAGFFSTLSAADEEDEECAFAFDRSEEEAAEAAEEEARKAAETRRAIVKAGGAGRGGAVRVSVRDAAAALADLEEGERGAERVSDEEEDEYEAESEELPAAGGEAPARPNRAERRAAEAAARAEAERAAAAAIRERETAEGGFDLYGDSDLPAIAGNAEKGWEELADDLDIDAI